MGQPAAKANDQVVAVDTHLVLVPAGVTVVPTPLPHPFTGMLTGGLCTSVTVGGAPAATAGSTAVNQPAHLPTPPGTSFVVPPSNTATVRVASATVTFGGQGAARAGDIATTCNDPAEAPVGNVVAAGTVLVGG
jgi:uncharacterized Zn-binding protein involved in type VI secretion